MRRRPASAGLLFVLIVCAYPADGRGRVALPIEGDDGTQFSKRQISALLPHPEEAERSVKMRVALGSLKKPGLADLPIMALAADRAAREHVVALDAQQGIEFAVDPDVDISSGLRTNEVQMLHDCLRIQDAL